jgi:transcriptional regulator with XRE-family HTH domain
MFELNNSPQTKPSCPLVNKNLRLLLKYFENDAIHGFKLLPLRLSIQNINDMNDQIKQIAARLKGLREDLELAAADMAEVCGVNVDAYLEFESGEVDIPVGALHAVAREYNIELTALLFGDEPHMNSYFVTRAGNGTAVERTKAYKYQSLAAGFAGRKVEPFMVTVHPKGEDDRVFLNSHEGQEFNIVIEGRMAIRIDTRDIVLDEGDSIYFNGEYPHGMLALDNKPVRFLAVII